ncbi:MAG: class F sortase [Actinoplanes sp.]
MNRRLPLLAAAVVLAAGGCTAIAVGHSEELPAVVNSPSPPPADAPRSSDGELTSGLLLPTSPPTRVEIPALRVRESVIGLGQQADGSMAVPADARTIGWYTKAPTPGALGPAVLAGHVDLHGKAGTFARLSTLEKGDQVRVTRQDGRVAVFAVTAVDRYPKNQFPADAVYGAIDHAGLRLITCGGDFDRSAGHYVDNIVVYADLRDVTG